MGVDEAVAGFDWDAGNREKCQRHGVSIAEIVDIFAGDPFVAPDLKHGHAEDRFIAVGRDAVGRPVFIAFTIRTKAGRKLIRPVSARYMHRKEAARYEAQSSQAEN